MSYLGQNSKSTIGFSIQDTTLKKISQFISHFHTALLPRTNNRKVYRDLTEEQDYLLSNLEQNSNLHSILAGCLAIDSCLSNVFDGERLLTNTIIEGLQKIYEVFKCFADSCNNEDEHYKKDPEQILSKFRESLMFLVLSTQLLPFVDKEELKILKTKLESVNMLKTSRKYITPNKHEKQKLNGLNKIAMNSQDAAIDQIRYQEEQKLESELTAQKTLIHNLKTQFNREKTYLNREINRLEDELKAHEKFSNNNLIALVQQLQFQIDSLKAERRHDERLLSQIQQKINLMSIQSKSNKILKQSALQDEQQFRRMSRIEMDRKNQRVRSSYMKEYEKTNPKTSRAAYDKNNNLMFDIFNEVPIRKSMIRDYELLDNRDASVEAYNKLYRQKSANFRINPHLEQEIQPRETYATKEIYRLRTQPQQNNLEIRLTRKNDPDQFSREGRFESRSRGNRLNKLRINQMN